METSIQYQNDRQNSSFWVPTTQLAHSVSEKYGTPTFIYSADYMKSHFLNLRNKLHKDIEIFYSMKANPSIKLTNRLSKLGVGAEVCSLAELQAALHSGIQSANIIFVGPAKSTPELTACIKTGIYAVVCESFHELTVLNDLAREYSKQGRRVSAMIRVNPKFTGKGAGLAMSGKPRQFGIDECLLRESVDIVNSLDRLDIIGFHVYMGTRYLDADSVIYNTKNIFALAKSLTSALNIKLRAIDIGGGLGVPYFQKESPIDLDRLTNGLNLLIDHFRIDNPRTRLIMELGRYLVAGCGTLLTRVRDVKLSKKELFAIADGGTNLHMAAVGIGSFVKRNFPILNLTSDSNENYVYIVTGPLCTPNDTLAKRVILPEVRRGDILAIMISGAYGPTASPTGFLSHGYPSEVMLEDGRLELMRQRDTVEDILRPQLSLK